MAIPNETVAELKTPLVFKVPSSMKQALNLAAGSWQASAQLLAG